MYNSAKIKKKQQGPDIAYIWGHGIVDLHAVKVDVTELLKIEQHYKDGAGLLDFKQYIRNTDNKLIPIKGWKIDVKNV